MKPLRNRWFVAISNFGPEVRIRKGQGKGPIRVAKNLETAVVDEPLDAKVITKFIECGPSLSTNIYFNRKSRNSILHL